MVIFLFFLQLVIIAIVFSVLYSLIQNKTNLTKIHQYIDQRHKDLVTHLKSYDIRINDLHSSLSLDLKNYEIIKKSIDKTTLEFDRKIKELIVLEKEVMRNISDMSNKEKKLNKSLVQINDKTTFLQTMDAQIGGIEQKMNSFYEHIEKIEKSQTNLQGQLDTSVQKALEKTRQIFEVDLEKVENDLKEKVLKIEEAVKTKYSEVSNLEKKIKKDLIDRNDELYAQLQNEIDVFLVEEKKENNEKIKLWLEEVELSVTELKEKVVEIDQLQDNLTQKQNDIGEEVEDHKHKLTQKMNQLSDNILDSFEEKVHSYQEQVNTDIEKQYQGFVEKITSIELELDNKEADFIKRSNEKMDSVKDKIENYSDEIKQETSLIYNQYKEIETEIKNKIPERINLFEGDFTKIKNDLKGIEELYLNEKKQFEKFNDWLEEAKGHSTQYLNNLLDFIEDKKQNEIKSIEASFENEIGAFKSDTLENLKKTLADESAEVIQKYLADYESKIQENLIDFGQTEEKKINEKITEIQKTAEAKLVEFESELEQIKALPSLVETQSASLKETISAYEKQVVDEIDQISDDKVVWFKEQIIKQSELVFEKVETVNADYESIKVDINDEFPKILNSFDDKLKEMQQFYFSEKERLGEFNTWLEEAKSISNKYINNLLDFIEEKKQNEVQSIEASFENEISDFKNNILNELKKTLADESVEVIQKYLADYESKIQENLIDFGQTEEKKINEKITEIQKTAEAKLVEFETELEDIKALPALVETQSTSLKEAISAHEKQVIDEIDQISDDKVEWFKEQIIKQSELVFDKVETVSADYESIKVDINDEFPKILDSFDDKLKEMQQFYFSEKERLGEFNTWLEEAKSISNRYINNLLDFIEEKKQNEVQSIEASFENEISDFKNNILNELKKTLEQESFDKIEKELSQYESKIENSLLDFTEEEQRKIADKIKEIEVTAEQKLGELESELEYVKNLPQIVETECDSLKKEIDTYQRGITDQINQESENKVELFKQKINQQEEQFYQELETQYSDFVEKAAIIKIDVEEIKKRSELYVANNVETFKEQIKGHRELILNEVEVINEEYHSIKEDIYNKFPKELEVFNERVESIDKKVGELEKRHFNQKEKITDFHKWLVEAEETSKQYLSQLLEFIDQLKEEKSEELVALIQMFGKNIEEDYQNKTTFLQKTADDWASKNNALHSLEKQALEKSDFLEGIFNEFVKNEKKSRLAISHQVDYLTKEINKQIQNNEKLHSGEINKQQKRLIQKIDLKTNQLDKTAQESFNLFNREIKDKLNTIEADLIKKSHQTIENFKGEFMSLLKTKDVPQLNYFVHEKENDKIEKRLNLIESNLGLSGRKKGYLNKIFNENDHRLSGYKKEFSLMKKTFLEKEFLLEEKFQANLESLNKKYYKEIKSEQKHLSKQKSAIDKLITEYESNLSHLFKDAEKIKFKLVDDFEAMVNESKQEQKELSHNLNQSIHKASKDLKQFKGEHKKELVVMSDDLKNEIDRIESKWSKNLKTKFDSLNKELNVITDKIDIFLEQSDLFVKVDRLTEKAQLDIKSYQQMIKNIEKKSEVVDSIHKKLIEAKNLEGQVQLLNSQINLEKQDISVLKKDLSQVKTLSESVQKELTQFDISKKEIKQYLTHIDKHKERLDEIQNIINNFTETKTQVVIVTEQIKDIITENKNLQKNSHKVEQVQNKIEKKISAMEKFYEKINIDKNLLLDFDKRYETFELMLEDLTDREGEVNALMDSLSSKEEGLSELLFRITKEMDYYQDVLGRGAKGDKGASGSKESDKNLLFNPAPSMSEKDLKKLEKTVIGLLELGWDVKNIAKNLAVEERIILEIKNKNK